MGPGSKFFEGVEALEAGDGRDGSVGGGFVERLNDKAQSSPLWDAQDLL